MAHRYTSLNEFYPFYLSQHRNGTCRTLHFLGTTSVAILFGIALLQGPIWLFAILPVAGYGPAWFGHFFFEKNKPATFEYPGYSLVADWIMWADILRMNIPIRGHLNDAMIARRTEI